jgi:hypothetical protein
MRNLILFSVLLTLASSPAFARGGRGGGGRNVGRASVSAGRGVSHSATAGSRYHNYHAGVTHPGMHPGVSPVRVAARTTARVAYRTAVGTSYYYGTPTEYAPTGCSSVYWEGMMVQDCNGTMYTYDDSAYYPIVVE